MRHILAILFVFLLSAVGRAQNEQDFASRFMALYGGSSPALKCATVSPDMMGQVLRLPEVKDDGETREMLSQLKTIQIVEYGGDGREAKQYFQKAVELAKRNAGRYRARVDAEDDKVYTRQRKGTVLEMVLVKKTGDTFCAISITGNMTQDFLRHLLSAE